MNAIVVYLDPLQGGGGSVCWVSAPFDIPNPHAVCVVMLDEALAVNGPNVVRRTGELLADKIRENVAVKSALDIALAQPNAQPTVPICFRVGDPAAHGLGWEALVGNDRFLALDDRWPIARIARGSALETRPRRSFAPRLRLVCVLSAVQVPAAEEWVGIHAAVTAARAEGLRVQVTVFAGEPELVQAINGLGEKDTSALPVPGPGAPVGLVEAVEKLEPHLVHLFCHGSIVKDVHRLEVGTASDFGRDDGVSSVLVLAQELGIAVARAQAWGVVLNTCRSAQASGESLTHAEQFVKAKVPVAVGMKRQVDVADAVAFSASFYPEFFRMVHAVREKGPGEHDVSWPDLLLRARRRLRDLHGADPDSNDAWTLPVLYSSPGGFSLVVTGQQAAEDDVQRSIGEVGTVDGMVAAVSDAPPGFLDDLRAIAPAGFG